MSCCSGDGSVTTIDQKPATSKHAIDMTHEAAMYIEDVMKKEGNENRGLRIEVIPGGCAGFKYFMEFREAPEEDDKVFEFHGVKLFMSLMSVGFIKGSTIEYISSLEASGLKVNNPNATRTCGCGKSFG